MIGRKSVARALGIASATFPNYPTTVEMIDAYSLLLSDLDITEDQLLEAVGRVLKSQAFFPTVFAIREELVSSLYILAPSNALVWKEIIAVRDARREAVKKLDRFASGSDEWEAYKSSDGWKFVFDPKWSHIAITETIKTLGGWNEVYSTLERGEGISTYRSQLWKIYEEYARTSNRAVYLGQSSTRKELE